MMIRFITYIALLLLPILGFTQENATPFQNFAKGHDLEWIKPFVGELGNTKVKLSLQFDGYLCKGEMTYLKSGLVVNLDGTIKNDSIKLLEYENNQLTGVITGNIHDNTIHGDWISPNGDELVSFFAQKPTQILDNTVQNTWIKIYKDEDDETFLILMKNGNNDVVVKKWDKANPLIQYFDGEQKDDTYELVDFATHKTIIATEKKQNTLQVASQGKHKNLKYQNFIWSQTIPLKTKSFANHSVSYEFIFPNTKNEKLNQLIQNKINPWLKNCRKQVQSKNKKKFVNEKKQRGFSWFELTYADQHLFSGILYFRNTWNNEIKTQTINYSFDKKSEITLDRVFKKRAKYNLFIQKKLENKLKQVKNEDKSFQQWLKHANFKYLNFGKDYLFASTEMSGLYGKETILIPWKDLNKFLKRKNWVKPL